MNNTSHKIENPDQEIYWLAYSQLTGVKHVGTMSSENTLQTGQPLLFSSLTKFEILDLLYTEYTLLTPEEIENDEPYLLEIDDDTIVKSGTEREILYSEYSSKSMANAIVTTINSLNNMKIDYVTHKFSATRFLVPFSQYAWDSMTPEQQAPLLSSKEAMDGLRYSKSDLVLEDWNI